MEDEYSSNVNMFFKEPNQENAQQLPSSSNCIPNNGNQGHYNYMGHQSPNIIPHTQNENTMMTMPFVPKIESFNSKENLQSVVIIIVLFMILSSGTFKNIISPFGFFKIENGNYTFTTLFLVGLLFAILYVISKTFLF